METRNCEICGGNVTVLGEVTKYYKNLDLGEITNLKNDNQFLKDILKIIAGLGDMETKEQIIDRANSALNYLEETNGK